MPLRLNLPYVVPDLILRIEKGLLSRSGTWEGHCVRRIEMSIEAEFTWSRAVLRSVYLVWSSLEVSLWRGMGGGVINIHLHDHHVALSHCLWPQRSLQAKYMCLFDFMKNISILSDCDENHLILGPGLRRILTRQCQRERFPFVEEDPKIVRIHW